MDLNQLKTFVTVAEAANLTKASELLYLSQPAVSAQIKALESELGVQLFNRTARGMILTVPGQALKQDALRALAAAKSVFSRAQSFRDGLSGECRIGTISEPVMLRLSALLSNLMECHPNLSLKLNQCISGVVEEQLLEGKLHGGYVIGQIDNPRIVSIPVHPITLRVVAPYAWRDRVLGAEWDVVSQLPWIGMPAKCSFQRLTANLFARHGETPRCIVAVDQEGTLRQLVSSGLGLALMREDMALDAEAKQDVVIWPKGQERSMLNFIYLQSEAHNPIVQAMCESVREVWDLPDEEEQALLRMAS
ncbi:LysR family transcriptional regulator [Chromobacterium alticapitis]|uniref:LysR family transcriptional regulator n=1 Tax=Chromobacterium alticapitis TaxID=2073169 RepID=A0A2S5DJM9_9NEIS|nr:LysR family transcriptional regulator [Chromobacterium alticapitis]POZ63231.1 LysR family transcriptional regulator [Chromobacterium alticapitis]